MSVARMVRPKYLCILVTVISLIGIGVSLLALNSTIFDGIVKSQLVLSPTSGSFPMWQDLPEPMLAKMYVFHVKNPAMVLNGAKPELEERGPYVFTEQHHKTNLVWNRNGTVTYQQVRTWHFVPELTNGTLEDKVTIANSIAATIGSMVKDQVPAGPLRWGVSMALAAIKEKLFVDKTVGEIIFDGYDDPFLEDTKILTKFGIKIPGLTDKFGFFYARNNSVWQDGVFNMFTGSTTPARMGKVFSWNYNQSNFFPGSCGKVHGGAGEFYPPSVPKTHIEMYSNDLCRSLKFNYKGDVYPHGIHTQEFKGDHDLFANGTDNPENSCFNPDGVDLPSGLYNVSLCRFNAPVFISFPHFYLADPYYGSRIKSGINPDKAKHETYFRIEPRAGIPIDVAARFQINLLLEPVPQVTLFSGLTKTYIPVMWFENVAGVPANLQFQMKMLSLVPDIIAGMGWAMVGVSISVIIIFSMLHLFKPRKTDDMSPILNQSLVEEHSEAGSTASVNSQNILS